MSITALAAHPAHVAFVPRRGRKERSLLAGMRTPVAIPEAAASEFERPGAIPCAVHALDVEPWIRDGVAWHPVRDARDDRASPAPAIDASALKAYVEGSLPMGSPTFRGLDRAFKGTPLTRRLNHLPARDLHFGETRGWRFDDAEASRILSDDREESAAALAAFVASEILVVDGTALVRLRPTARRGAFGRLPWEVAVTPEARVNRPVFSVGRTEGTEALWPKGGIPAGAPAEVEAGERALAAVASAMRGVRDDWHDVVAMANVLPGAVSAGIEPFAAGRHSVPSELMEACKAADAGLRRLVRLGDRGMIGLDAVPAALGEMVTAGRLVREMSWHSLPTNVGDALRSALSYAERYALPRLDAAAPIEAADAGALSFLAP